MSTFRLSLPLPFGVVLVHYWGFQSAEAAQAFSERLPPGFSVQPEDEVPLDAIVIPFNKEKHVKPEEIKAYETTAICAVEVGTTVFVPAYRKRGLVVDVSEDHVGVSIDGRIMTLPKRLVFPVPKSLD